MRRWLILITAMVGLAAGTARAADTGSDGPRLRRWHVGIQANQSQRSRFDVFDRADIPAGAVEQAGRGGGLAVGYRFGDRFLLQMQLAYAAHDIAGAPEIMGDVEALITGTVLFRERHTLQPFLRGGFGGGGQILELEGELGHLLSLGTIAVAGGGVQVRLGDRVSLEIEAVATFTNFLEVQNESTDPRWSDESWQVRVSNQGWRTGAGVVFWF